MKCPSCLMENASNAEQCKSCGISFETGTALSPQSSDYVGDYFGFRRMVTPFWIKISHMLGMFAIMIVSGIAIAFPYVFAHSTSEDMRVRLGGILLLIVGNLVWRMLCEGAIVIFSMHSLLMSLDDRARWIAEVGVFQKN
jgi:hypothetical protein